MEPQISILDAAKYRDLTPDAIDEYGRLKILPASFWADTTWQERALFGHRHGLYAFPTTELVTHLNHMIGGRTAIEIGAGNGVLAEALEIPATDSYQQTKAKYRKIYEAAGQPIVPYGTNVKAMDASEAVYKHRPQVVIACWVTERYDHSRPLAGGNEDGVDEQALLDSGIETYILVGADRPHRDKKIWRETHTKEYLPFVYSRAAADGTDFIARWDVG